MSVFRVFGSSICFSGLSLVAQTKRVLLGTLAMWSDLRSPVVTDSYTLVSCGGSPYEGSTEPQLTQRHERAASVSTVSSRQGNQRGVTAAAGVYATRGL